MTKDQAKEALQGVTRYRNVDPPPESEHSSTRQDKALFTLTLRMIKGEIEHVRFMSEKTDQDLVKVLRGTHYITRSWIDLPEINTDTRA